MLKFHKVNTLPGTLDADSFYFVLNGTVCEGYVTNSAGLARGIFSTSLTNAAIDTKLAALNVLVKVADIAARNALTKTANMMILVVDATADTSVIAGAALYFYEHSTTSYSKVAEYESMDVVTAWSSISGRPTSSPAQIDAAVTNSHTHTNKTTLDKLGEASGALTFDGAGITASWTTTAW